MVDVLVSLGADVNICGEGAAIPLHMAAQYGNVSDVGHGWSAVYRTFRPIMNIFSLLYSSPWSRSLLNLEPMWSVQLLSHCPISGIQRQPVTCLRRVQDLQDSSGSTPLRAAEAFDRKVLRSVRAAPR